MRCIKCNELIGAFDHVCPDKPGIHPHSKLRPIDGCPCSECSRKRDGDKYWLKTFWMVYVEGKSGPTMRHDSQQSALAEARRLALLTGKRAYVLEGQCVVEVRPNPVDVLPLRQGVDPDLRDVIDRVAHTPWAGT